ncbi:CHASE2 domain-containing protein [Spirulina subsalsa]|uniref:CHASE2 domain-containing protein n=1 Tax=Spirulina subsalsa TaxID=54311 RepID=UPI00232B55B6|nr:CHASE2 domain-containing protein [Spirulina subsalsa]
MILLRFAGGLELWELLAYDWLVRSRPPLPQDERIIIVEFDEIDIQKLNWPFSDATMAKLLATIKAGQPRLIGLDVYRDQSVREGSDNLQAIFQSTRNLVGIEKIIPKIATIGASQQGRTIPPPPDLPSDQVGFNDLPIDMDNSVRRVLLYANNSDGEIRFSFSFLLAKKYLQKTADIEPTIAPDGETILFGKAALPPLEPNAGGYQREDMGGYPVMLNYSHPAERFESVSFVDVLAGEVDPKIFRDRIVLIGSVAPSLQDFRATPYRQPSTLMSGVEIHANATHFLIDAALGDRQPIRTLPELAEIILIILGAGIGTFWVSHWRTVEGLTRPATLRTLLQFTGAIAVIVGASYGAFLLSWWIPMIPVLLALGGATTVKFGVTLLEYLLQSYRQIEDYARTLELKVEARTEELRHKNHELEQTLVQLKTAQHQIIAQERLASLGSLTAGVAHEIQNPLNFVNNFARISGELTEEMAEELEEVELEDDTQALINDILSEFKECVDTIRHNGQRIERIVDSMLSHTREGGGQAELVDLNIILHDAIELVEHTMVAKQSQWPLQKEISLAPELPPLLLVAKDFSKALINILTNALEAMERKRQQGNDSDYLPHLKVSTSANEGRVWIRIWDNGEGIPPEHHQKIFDPFFTTKPTGEGTGLGLSLAHQTLVSVHQGNITVNSEVGEFTEFVIDVSPTGAESLLQVTQQNTTPAALNTVQN